MDKVSMDVSHPLPINAISQAQPVICRDKVKLGIIGIGGMGSNHAQCIVEGKVPEMKLTAVADIKEARRSGPDKNSRRMWPSIAMARN